jgi:hypothetical protein
MKRSIDLRSRVVNLIKALQEIPSKHRTPALDRLLSDLMCAVAVYDGEPEGDGQ